MLDHAASACRLAGDKLCLSQPRRLETLTGGSITVAQFVDLRRWELRSIACPIEFGTHVPSMMGIAVMVSAPQR